MLIIKIVLTTKETTTKVTENDAGKESLIMRKQGYAIIGIGLAMLAGVFWMAQLDGKKETTTTAAKPTISNQEATVDSPTEKPINHFAGMRNQSSSEVEPLSEEDKALLAEIEARDKKREAYQNSPRGNWMESYQDSSDETEDWYDKRQIARYKTNPDFRATADLEDWIFRQTNRRSKEYHDAMWEKFKLTLNTNVVRPQDLPNSTATVAEAKARKAINEIQTGWARDPEPWQEVAAFLRDRRNFSQTELNQGNPADPNWHADHIEWIEQTAQTIGIPLDNPDDKSWIAEKIAAAEEQYYQDFNAPMVEEFKKIDEEMAAAFEAWAREPDSKEKEVATRHNQLIKQRKQQLAQQEQERRYQEEMARNPVFKEMELWRPIRSRARARQAQKQAEQPSTSKTE